jgi:hypothetical protein
VTGERLAYLVYYVKRKVRILPRLEHHAKYLQQVVTPNRNMSREGRDEAKRAKGGFATVYFDSTGSDLGCSQESDNLAHRHKKHIASGMIENSFFRKFPS